MPEIKLDTYNKEPSFSLSKSMDGKSESFEMCVGGADIDIYTHSGHTAEACADIVALLDENDIKAFFSRLMELHYGVKQMTDLIMCATDALEAFNRRKMREQEGAA